MDQQSEAEFEQFVRDRAPALLQVAFLVTGDAHAAEDLLQAALAKPRKKSSKTAKPA